MGFDPAADRLSRYFAVGITAPGTVDANAHTAAVNSGLNFTDCPAAPGAAAGSTVVTTPSVPTAHQFVAGKGIGSAIANAATFIPASMTGVQGAPATMTFTIGAGGVVDSNFTTAGVGPTGVSSITINQAKVFSVIQNGY